MDRPIIVLGAGGHGKVVIDTLLQQGASIIGIADYDITKKGERILGVPIIGNDADVFQYPPQSIYVINGLGSIGSSKARRELFIKFKNQGYDFPIMVHPSAIIATDVQLKEGSQVMAGAVIQTGSKIGENSIVNTRASIDHDCVIAPHVHISPGVTMCGGVVVGTGTHIGAGTTIIQEITIGSDCMIGAGSLVIRNVAVNKVAFGHPAREVMR